VGYPLDLRSMQREAAVLVGQHDFAAFRSSADTRDTTVRELTEVRVESIPEALPRESAARIEVVVTGNRFLHNMVRILVGTLVDVGRGHLPPGTTERALERKRREELGMTAPAEGLYLEHVELDDFGVEAWPG